MLKYLVLILFFLIALYFYLIFPRLSKRKEMDIYSDYYYAHRGLHNEQYPENSLAAFEHAKNKGYGMELDVQLTKDKQLIVLHDFNLLRACGIDLEVDSVDYEDLQQYPLFNSEYKIPLFSEVLECIDGLVPLIVEIKQKAGNCSVCEATYALLKDYKGFYVVESFNPIAMNWFYKFHPDIIRGQLSTSYANDKKMASFMKKGLEYLLANVLSRPDFVAYDVNHVHNFSFQLLKKVFKTKTVLWTVKDEQTFTQYKQTFDCVIFENFEP